MSNQIDNYTLRTCWVMWRNSVLGSLRFQQWAARIPLVRGIARRRASAQFDLVAGFVYSQILLAHVDSGLIDHLSGHARRFDGIANFLRLSDAATLRLLRAGQALRLVESPEAGVWTLGEAGAPLSANQGAMAMIRHHPLLYRDLAEPLALLARDRATDTELSAFWTYAAKSPLCGADAVAPYSELMAATQPMVAQQALGAYRFARHRRILDVGGGSGGFVTAMMAQAAATRFGIFDLPDVLTHAQQRLGDAVAAGAVSLHPGHFAKDSLPGGYDLITLVRILHDHDDGVAEMLLRKIYDALPPGGQLLIIEPMAETPSAPRMGDAYFGLYLWAMGSGAPRTPARLTAMLRVAGFAKVQQITTDQPIITSMLLATRG